MPIKGETERSFHFRHHRGMIRLIVPPQFFHLTLSLFVFCMYTFMLIPLDLRKSVLFLLVTHCHHSIPFLIPSLHYSLFTQPLFKKRKLYDCSVFKRKAAYSVYYWLVVLFLVVVIDACNDTAYVRFACFSQHFPPCWWWYIPEQEIHITTT